MESASKDTAEANARRRRARRAYAILAAVAIAVAAIWGVHRWWTHGKETTDDAQIEADVVPIAGRVGGVIKAVVVKDHQLVKAGEPLFELDPSDLDVEVARTEAELDAARAQVAAADAQVAIVQSSSKGGLSTARAVLTGASSSVRGANDQVRAAEAAVAKAKADLATAELDLGRAKQLFAKEAITQRELEHAQQTYDVARAALDSANAQLDGAHEMRGMASARVAEAEGRVTQSAPVDAQVAAAQAASKLAAARLRAADVAHDRAKLQRSYATITAPSAGYVSRLAAHAGQYIQPGQALVMLVPAETYIIANFKENQVSRMQLGDPVDITIDAFSGETFHGVVDTLSPATGARFSLIPPDNATGNFVKVVQRVPVKITWKQIPRDTLRPGLSAEVTVHVQD